MFSPVNALRAIIIVFCVFLPPLPAQAEASITPVFKPLIFYFKTSDLKEENSFIKAALTGAQRAKKELGIEYRERAVEDGNDLEKALAEEAAAGYSPIIAIGYLHVLAVQNVANQYPKTRFSVIDGLVPPLYPNVQSVTFKDHEGAFLVGYIAARISQTNHIGFIGGVDVPLIRNFAYGYKQGADYAKKDMKVDIDMVGDTLKSWSEPNRAFDLAYKQYDNGADVIFTAAGASSQGVLKASQVYNKYSIASDTNQNSLYPGNVLTSMVKRVDIAVFDTLKSAKLNKWEPGIRMLGIREGALDYAVDENNKNLIGEKLVEELANVKERIINGIINVDSYTVR